MEIWKYRVLGSVAALLLLLAVVLPFTQTQTEEVGMAEADDKGPLVAVVLPFTQTQTEEVGMAEADDKGPLVGGIHDSPVGHENDLNVIDLARFAVSEHNKKANALLEFENLVKVKQQIVAGTMYYFTIQVKEGSAKKLYEAKVWEKQWENFKELKEFKPVEGGASA